MMNLLVIVLYFEDKKSDDIPLIDDIIPSIDDTPSYYNDHKKKNKAAFTNLQQ